MIKKIIIMFGFLCVSINCYSKENNTFPTAYWGAGISCGPVYTAADNESVSPLVYTSISPFFGAIAKYHSKYSIFFMDVQYSKVEQRNKKYEVHGSTHNISLLFARTAYMRSLLKSNKFLLYCGGLLEIQMEITALEAEHGSGHFDRLYHYGSFSAAPIMKGEYLVTSDQTLSAGLYVPLLYYAIRPK